jgi:hypothetical protein
VVLKIKHKRISPCIFNTNFLLTRRFSNSLSLSYFPIKILYAFLSSPSETNSSPRNCPLSWYPKIRHRALKWSPLDLFLSQVNPDHICTPYLFKINLNVIVPSTVSLQVLSSSGQACRPKCYMHFPSLIQKQRISKLVRKWPVVYGNRRLAAVFTRARHSSLPEPDGSGEYLQGLVTSLTRNHVTINSLNQFLSLVRHLGAKIATRLRAGPSGARIP